MSLESEYKFPLLNDHRFFGEQEYVHDRDKVSCKVQGIPRCEEERKSEEEDRLPSVCWCSYLLCPTSSVSYERIAIGIRGGSKIRNSP